MIKPDFFKEIKPFAFALSSRRMGFCFWALGNVHAIGEFSCKTIVEASNLTLIFLKFEFVFCSRE